MFTEGDVTDVCKSHEFISQDCFAKAVMEDIAIADEYKDKERLVKRTNDKTLQEYRDLVRAITNEHDAVKLGKLKRTLNEHYPDHTIIIRDAATHEDKAYRVPNPYHALSYREDPITTFANPSGSAVSRYDPEGKMHAMNADILKKLVPAEMIADKAMAIALLESFWFCGQNPDVGSDPRCFPARILGELREYQAGRIQQAQEVEAREVLKKSSWPAVKRMLWAVLVATAGEKVFPFNDTFLPEEEEEVIHVEDEEEEAGGAGSNVEEVWPAPPRRTAAAAPGIVLHPAKKDDIVGVYLMYGGNLLVHRRSNTVTGAPNTISTPGGSVDTGESFDTAARREFEEESGYKIPTGVSLEPFYSARTPRGRNIVLFTADLSATGPRPTIPGPTPGSPFATEIDGTYDFAGMPDMESAGPGSGHAWVLLAGLEAWLNANPGYKHHNFIRALNSLQNHISPVAAAPPGAALPRAPVLPGTGLPGGGTPARAGVALPGAGLPAAGLAAAAKNLGVPPPPAPGAARGLVLGPMAVPIIRQLGTVGAGVPRVLPFALGTVALRA